uniref:hypothetical protein n=1 Tax=Eubacterium cellulosolvens TaxID=29322 RepID=UPI000685F8BC|nr:hypothetical protein [[Eubacterium] cellulosolvens]
MRKRMRILSVALCLGLVMALTAGCGESTGSSSKKTATSASSEADDKEAKAKEDDESKAEKLASVVKEAEALKGQTAKSDEDEPKEEKKEDKDEKKDEKKAASGKVTVEEQVLYDKDGVKITATGYETGGYMGDGIKLRIENNTDKSMRLCADALIVNECMIDSMLAVKISAGKNANEVMYLSKTELEAAGIDQVGQVEVYFRAYDDETYDTIFKSDCITIKTSAYDSMDTRVDDSGEEIYNEGGIRIVAKELDDSKDYATKIQLFMENNSGKKVTVSVDDVSVNGTMVQAYMASEVVPGRRRFDDITFLGTDLEKNDIKSIENVELKFKIYDSETYETIAETDTVTILTK